jgi:transcriptional regulator with XRE-family HTH domain
MYNSVMMLEMNKNIRESVRIEMLKRNVTQTELAEAVGVSRQYLNKLLHGHADGGLETWEQIFDKVGLELIVQPKKQGN